MLVSHFEMKRKPSQHIVFCTDCLLAFGGAPVSPVNHASTHSVTIVLSESCWVVVAELLHWEGHKFMSAFPSV